MGAAEKMPLTTKGKPNAPNDIYTVLLGLALLVLVATTALVCYRGWALYESVFKVTAP